jgi:simple sugar transport system substrate-binding protein
MYKNLKAWSRAFFIVLSWSYVALSAARAESPPLQVGFVYVAPLMPSGWVAQHDAGRRAMESAINTPQASRRVVTRYVENVAEGADAERVIREMARDGVDLIITPSFGYMEPTLRVAAEFPQVRFESITGYKRVANVATANARYYEGRYLAGVAAGRVSKSHIAGYVAGFPIPEVLQGINAFTLGMRSVRPDAQVKVIWLQAWFDPAREREAAMTLMNQNADVLAFHTGSNAVMVAAQERGRWAVAYHSDMRDVAPQAQLLAVTHHWGDYYTQRARDLMDGRWTSGDTWGGVKEGMVKVQAFGKSVPATVRREVLARRDDIAAGRLHPFHGPLKDQDGRTVLPAGEVMPDARILGMDFLVEGVSPRLPRAPATRTP